MPDSLKYLPIDAVIRFALYVICFRSVELLENQTFQLFSHHSMTF